MTGSAPPGEGSDSAAAGPPAGRRPGPARGLAATVLVLEAFVVLFAVLVGKDLADVSDRTIWSVGGGVALACLVATGLLRSRWGYPAGWLVQVAVIALGVVVPTMYFLGAVFLALWLLALYLPRLAEQRLRARRPEGGDGEDEARSGPAA